MAYGLYLKPDQVVWNRYDFSTENKLTGTIYTDKALSSAKNLTGYTLTIRLSHPNSSGDVFNKTGSIVTASSGTWSYTVTSGEMPANGIYVLKVDLNKSGVVESTLNRVEFHVRNTP